MKPRAFVELRADPPYRREAFMAGLTAAGYDARLGFGQGGPGDVLVIWNRYAQWHDMANRFETTGGTVIVAENGYLAPGGLSPHSMPERDVYAIALHGHNGGGWTPDGDASRWDALGIELQPWRTGGEHILVCPNRSFGTPGRIMPTDWAESVRARLQNLTGREVRIRAHPGNKAPQKPLAEDMENCWAMVIWHTSAGVHALIAGVPVICEAPFWICKDAACVSYAAFEALDPALSADRWRLDALRRLAWAQWNVDEIRAGAPFIALRQAQRLAA